MFDQHIVTGGPKTFLHAAVAVGNRVYSFGGKERYGLCPSCPIEVHVLHAAQDPYRWERLTQMDDKEPVPTQRIEHTAVHVGNTIYMWGGINETLGQYDTQLWEFDVKRHTWLRPTTSGDVPKWLWAPSACVLEKFMYIYGIYYGFTNSKHQVVYKLDTDDKVWTMEWTEDMEWTDEWSESNSGQLPFVDHHSSTIIGKKMYVFGGSVMEGEYYEGEDDGCFNKITVFDTETKRWQIITECNNPPPGRAEPSAFAHNGELYIFGGRTYFNEKVFNDLWKFKPETASWTMLMGQVPGKREGMCCRMVEDRLIFFGGMRNDDSSSDDGNDLYVLDVKHLRQGSSTFSGQGPFSRESDEAGTPHNP